MLGVTEQHLGWGQSVMYLASCGYMLSPYIAALRRAGIPAADGVSPVLA